MLKLIFINLIAILILVFLIWLVYPEKAPELAPEVQITFPEGFTLEQVQERLAANNILGEINSDLEGYLFPDTYRFYKNATLEAAVQKMQNLFQEKVGDISYDNLILASIVQKEVAREEDMKKAAGIFLKRLKINMPLQSDATINYITGKNLIQPSISDTQVKSDYNTYLNPGLPPQPICNPGLTAIKAVRNPEKTSYWYFLTPPGMETIYSETLEEHNIAKAKYLTIQNKSNKIKKMRKIALIIAPKDFKDEEYFVPKQIFEDAELSVDTVGYKFGPAIGVDGGEAKVDVLTKNFKPEKYDAIVFVGGTGAFEYFENQEAHQIAQETIKANKVLAAICIAPVILAKAGVLENREATVWSSNLDKKAIKILQDNGAKYIDQSVIQDKNIITANGPKAAKEFADKIIKMLE